jgi:hypothetical protein
MDDACGAGSDSERRGAKVAISSELAQPLGTGLLLRLLDNL